MSHRLYPPLVIDEELKKKVVKLYEEDNLTIATISTRTHVPYHKVRKILDEKGIKKRIAPRW